MFDFVLENATFGYTKDLFKNISFTLSAGDRVGLVGDNGCGKSTLLKCLVGELQLKEGKIRTPYNKDAIVYIPQELPNDMRGKFFYDYLLEGINAEERDYSSWRVDTVLTDLCPDTTLWYKKLEELSGGYQRLAAIARGVLSDPQVLFIDEPTNYLSIENILALEQWLNNEVKVPYLFVSHDREFLDNCTNRTLLLRNKGLIDKKMPYTNAMTAILQKDEADARQRQLEEAEIERIRKSAEKMRRLGLARQAKIREKRADKKEQNKTEYYVKEKRKLDLDNSQIRSNVMLTVSNFDIFTPDNRFLFRINDFVVLKNDRVALLAPNGTGKTTFIKYLMKSIHEPIEQKNPDGELVQMKFNIHSEIGYFDQQLKVLPDNKTINQAIASIDGVSQQCATKELINAGFPFDVQNKKIGSLSPGERARTMFVYLKVLKSNFFILDEPSNHLDIDGQDDLENALQSGSNTCIFVSHDRRLIENVATRFVTIKNGRLVELYSAEDFFALTKNQPLNSMFYKVKEKKR